MFDGGLDLFGLLLGLIRFLEHSMGEGGRTSNRGPLDIAARHLIKIEVEGVPLLFLVDLSLDHLLLSWVSFDDILKNLEIFNRTSKGVDHKFQSFKRGDSYGFNLFVKVLNNEFYQRVLDLH